MVAGRKPGCIVRGPAKPGVGLLGLIVLRLKRSELLVRPEGLEPWPTGSKPMNQRIIYNLEVGTLVIHRCALLPVIKDFPTHFRVS